MKNYKFNNFSIVLVGILFASCNTSFVNAAKIDGATLSGNQYIGNNNPSGSTITITENGSGDDYQENRNIFGGRVTDASDSTDNTIVIDGVNLTDSHQSIEGGHSTGTGSSSANVNNNSITIKNSTLSRNIWAGRANSANKGYANYNTNIIENSTITHVQLRGAITYGENGAAQYNTLFVKDSTMYGDGDSFRITGGFSQTVDITKAASADFNQLIYDGVTAYKDATQTSTVKFLFGGAGKEGKASGNRAYVRDLNKNIDDSVNILTNIVGGATWRFNSGGAESNIAVVVGDSKIANLYAGEVGFENGSSGTPTGSTEGANSNLAILNLTSNGKVTQNVYGGYSFDNHGTTQDNAVYFLNGTVGGVIVGGSKENTGNKLILGDSSSNFGERKAGSIENFESLQFNALKAATDTEKNAVLELTDSQTGANLSGVAINFLDPSTSDNSVKVTVGGNGGVGVEAVRDSDGGGKNAISNLTKNAIKYSPNLNEIAIVASGTATNNDIKETLKRTLNDGTTQDQATYGIGDTFNYTYEKINLEEAGKYYLINSLSDIENYQDIDIDDKLNNGKTLKDTSVETITAIQPNQIYKIIDKDTYTRNLRGMFAENKKAIYITGINEVEETWENDKFDTDEFTKFGKPSESGNTIIIAKDAGDLKGKTIYGGESKDKTVSGNSIIIEKDADLSNAVIIGGYSEEGEVASDNTIDLNGAQIPDVDIVVSETMSATISEVKPEQLINTNGAKVKSLTIAKSMSGELSGLAYTMPEELEIEGDFILADSMSGNASDNTLTIDKGAKAKNIYVGKAMSGDTNNNTANFNGGEITGTLHGGYSDTGTSSGNQLNVNSTMLKAGNVADFQILNFKKDDLSSTTSEANSALILTSNSENLDFSGVEVQIGGEKYNPSTDYGLGENQKFYLVSSQSDEKNSDKLVNFTDSKIAGKGESITHWDGSEGTVIDALQTNTEYVIDNADTFERTLRGMFVAKNTKALYLTGDSKMTEKIGDTIGGDDFFTKFGGDKGGNTIKLVPGDDGLDLSDITLDGGSEDNKLQIGDDKNKVETGKLKVKDVTSFTDIEMNVGKVTDDSVIVELTDGTNTDLSGSNVTLNIDDVSELDKGPVHVFKTSSGNDIAKNADSMTVNIGTTTTLTFEQKAGGDHFDLVIPEEEDDTPADDTPADDTPADDTPADKPTPTPITTTNPQTKIFNEARIAGLAAVWEGSYLISNHLDRIIPDAFSELFPYAIVEGYDKRYNTGSHVDALGFNANAGIASKGANSSGEFTMGTFVEYGISKYDAYLDDGTTGDGKNYYMGGGFFGKQENNSGSYFEGTFRIGQLVTDFDGDIDKKHYDFDVKSTYIAAHAGLGKVFALTQSNDLDIYARYFYTHIESAEVKLNDGTDLKFDSAQSNKIRVGLKDDFKLDDNNKLYVGAAYEYEFDAKAGARLFVPGYNTQGELLSPSLKGSTGIGEIGYEYKNDKIKFDAGVKGYVGKQEGVSAQMAISIAF